MPATKPEDLEPLYEAYIEKSGSRNDLEKLLQEVYPDAASSGGDPSRSWWGSIAYVGYEILGLMPGDLNGLTFFELQSLYWHYAREQRAARYNAFMTAWYPNHRDEDQQPTIEEFWPLPVDEGWVASQTVSLEEHVTSSPAFRPERKSLEYTIER